MHSSISPQPNHDDSAPPPSPIISMLALNVLVTVAHPWKSRHRTTFVALIALIALISVSTFVFFVAYPSFAVAPLGLRRPDDSTSRVALLAASRRWKVTPSHPLKEQVWLNPDQELAAVSSFLASLPQNVIPPSVDPLRPIDPQLVLDFDTRSPRAPAEVQVMVEDVWARNPVVLYSKLYSPISREIKTIIASMNLYPAPTIFDVDKRDDSTVLMPLLKRITSQNDFPILIIGGQPVGPLEHVRALKESGKLKEMMTAAGAVPDGAKRRKGSK